MPQIPSNINIKNCFDAFETLVNDSTDSNVKDAYTASVVFEKSDLLNWLNSCEGATTVKVVLACYTDRFKDEVTAVLGSEMGNKIEVGRMTTILVASDEDDNKIGAFNISTLEP